MSEAVVTSTSTTTSDRPSFAQAFASDSAAAPLSADPTPTTPESQSAAPTSADAIVPPATPEPAKVPPGPIPFDRHKDILDGAYKERDAFKSELQALEWAKTVDRQAVEQAAKIGQLYQTDRAGYVRQLFAEGSADPDLAPLLRSEAARVLGMRPTQPAAPAPLPDYPIQDTQGNTVASLAEVVNQHITAALQKHLTPLQQDFQSRQARDQQAKAEQQLQTNVTDLLTEAKAILPQFKEQEKEIAKVFATIPGDPAKALRQAWHQVVGSKLALADQVKAQQLTDLQTKAAASTPNPAGGAITTNKRVTSFHDPSLNW